MRLRSKSDGLFYGKLGDMVDFKTDDGADLYVGDVVLVSSASGRRIGLRYIIQNPNLFVGHSIIKVAGYEDVLGKLGLLDMELTAE